MGFCDSGSVECVVVMDGPCVDWGGNTVLVDCDCGNSVDVVVYATVELWSVVVVVPNGLSICL